jgi:non-homologous end joining protein Ku
MKSGVMLRLGLVAIPVTVHSTVADDDGFELKTVCAGGHGSVEGHTGSGKSHALTGTRQLRVCPACEATEDFGKALEYGEGLVPVDAGVLEAATAADSAHSGEIVLNMHPAADVEANTMPTGRSYYVSSKVGGSAYATIAEVIRRRPEVAFVALYAVRANAAALPYRLVADEDGLRLVQLADPSLVRERPKMVVGEVVAAELAMAETLVNSMVTAYDATSYARPRHKVLAEHLEGKAPIVAGEAPAAAENVVDLLSALQASVAAVAPKQQPVPRQAQTRKTTAKTAAKKTAAKRPA